MNNQIGFIILLVNENISDKNIFKIKDNIIYYNNTKSKRIIYNILAFKIYRIIIGININFII